ncbi:hypothetical protein [Streptomyces sp. NPDC008150]|uniref:hypothetical protein n=1 Tax=Streptomyces sp. NPDC008150 TaxID=3364816 RepID=UPI0036E1AB5D
MSSSPSAFEELGVRQEQARPWDRKTLITCLNQGLEMAHEQNLPLSWLTDAAYGFTCDHVWEETLRPRVPGVPGGPACGPDDAISTAGQALAIALVAIAERQHRHRAVTEDTLRRCLNAGVLSGEAQDLVTYFHSESTRDLGRAVESEAALRTLAARGGRMSPSAVKGLVHLWRRAGRFRDIEAALETLPAGPVRSRLAGDLWWSQARFDLADDSYLAARDAAWQQGTVGESALSESCRAFAAGFGDRDAALRTADSAAELLAAVDIRWAGLQVSLGRLLAAAGSDPGLGERCEDLARAARSAGLSSSAAYVELVRGFDGAVRQDSEALSTARKNLLAHTEVGAAGARQFGYLLDIIGFWQTADLPTPTVPGSTAEWIDGVGTTADRWRETVRRRRAPTARH